MQSGASTPTAGQIFYAKNIFGTSVGTNDTVTVTFTCLASCVTPTISSAGVVVVEYSGADQNNPLDSVSAGYSTLGNMTVQLDSGNVNPANSNLLVFGAGFADNPTLGVSAGTGFTSLQASHGSWGGGVVEDNTTAISGNNVLQRATACIATALGSCGTTGGNWLMQMAVFRDASWTVSNAWSPSRIGQIRYADQFPGGTADQQIINAIADLPASGGTVVAPSGTPTETIHSTIVVGTPTQPVTVMLGPSFYQCSVPSGGHCFSLQGSGSKIKGISQFATLIQPQSGFTGDVIHVEPPTTQNSLIDIELSGFRIDLTSAPSATAINLLSVRDPSHLHDIEIRNGTGEAINISTSTTGSTCAQPPLPAGPPCLSQGIGIDNVYIQTAGAALTNNTFVLIGNQVQVGPNVKIIMGQGATDAGNYEGLLIEPLSDTGGEGRGNSFFAGSIGGGYPNCVVISAPGGSNSGAQSNVIGPGNTFESCTGYAVVITGADSGHSAYGNWVFGNYYASTTTNSVDMENATNNWVWETGSTGNITLGTNSRGNNVLYHLRSAGQVVDSGSPGANWIVQDITNNISSNAEFHNGQVLPAKNVVFVSGDFTTDGTTNVQTITGLVMPLTANMALNTSLDCHLSYFQHSGNDVVTFYVNFGLAPMNAQGSGTMQTAAGVFVGNAWQTAINTAATPAFVSGTPSAITTVWTADFHAFIENPAQAQNNLTIQVKTNTGADTVTVRRDSYCKVF